VFRLKEIFSAFFPRLLTLKSDQRGEKMPSTRSRAIKEDAKPSDLGIREGTRQNAGAKGKRSQRSSAGEKLNSAAALLRKKGEEVPPAAADIFHHQQSQQKSNSGSNENNKNNSSDDNNNNDNNNNDNTNTNNNNDNTNNDAIDKKKKEKLSVMLIEDDVPTLLEVQSMLLRAGATEVHTASSGKKALEFLDRDSGKDIDLIFADIMMPEVKIDELKRVLKKNEKLKEVPVIVMSTVAQFDSNNDSGQREGGGSGNGSGNDLMNEYDGSLQHQQTAATTTRSSKRLKTNNNTPQGKTNSNEVLQKPLSFRRVENVVYSHKRLLRSHNSSSSEADKQQQQGQAGAKEGDPAKVAANKQAIADGRETKEGSAGGSGGGSGDGSGGSGPTTVKLINNESSEEDFRKKSSDGVNNATGAAVAPTTTASDEKTKTKDPNNNSTEMDAGGAIPATPTANDGSNNDAKTIQEQKQGDANGSPPLDEDVLKVRRAAATAGNERRRNDEKRWRNNRTHTRDDGDGSDEGSGAGGRNRSRSFSAEDDKTESDLKPPTVTRKKRSLRGSSAGATKVSGGSGSDEAALDGKLAFDGTTKVTTGVDTKATEGKDHPGLAVQLMNEHDGPTALLQLALAGSAMDSNASLRRSQSRSAFHGIIEKTQQKMQSQLQKVSAATKGDKKSTSTPKKGKGPPTRAAKTTAGGKNDKVMMNDNNKNNNVGLTMSAPTGSIETEEMRKARELHSMQQQHQNALYLFHAQQHMAVQQQHLMRQMSTSPGLPGTSSGQFPNLAAHMGAMGAMPPMQPFGFPPHGQHNPFMMFPMQSFPPQSEYMNNFFQGLASTVATQHPHHQMHNQMQNMNMNYPMGGANSAGNNTTTGANSGGKTNKKDSNTNNNASTCADRRAQAIARFLKKRKERKFEKKVRYESRQKLAESRPRVRGQFVKLDKSLSKEQQQEVIEKMRLEGEKKAGAKPTSTANVAVAEKNKSKKQSSDEKGGSNDKSSKDLNTTSGSDDDNGSGGSLNHLTSSDEKGSRGRSSNESKDGMDNNNNNDNNSGGNANNNNNSSDKGSDGHGGSTERRETPSL
jgi:CheY-like chemotaxis protein